MPFFVMKCSVQFLLYAAAAVGVPLTQSHHNSLSFSLFLTNSTYFGPSSRKAKAAAGGMVGKTRLPRGELLALLLLLVMQLLLLLLLVVVAPVLLALLLLPTGQQQQQQ